MARPRHAVADTPRHRKAQLAAIHVAKKTLGIDDEDYRDILETLTGRRSCKHMSELERARVLDHFRKLGFKPRKGFKRIGPATARVVERIEAGARPQEALILELWEALLRVGGRGHDARILSFMSRMGIRVDHPRFLTTKQANKVTEGLKAWLKRAKAERDLD